jgi:glycosyltransferase involved in cell wall biosynthesis
MKKTTISISTDENIDPICWVLNGLDKNKYTIIEFGKKKGIPAFENAGRKCLVRENNIFFTFYSLIFFIPSLFINLARLSRLKIKRSLQLMIISSYPEKLFLTLPAKLLKIKIIWSEIPGFYCRHQKKPLSPLYRLLARNTALITFTADEAGKLAADKINKKNIHIIIPGINPSEHKRQEKIFSRLADNEENQFKKFFTIGTALDLNEKQKIELLFSAVKKSSSVIPQIQLVVIGDGKERKNLAWIAKKMGIDGLVWFVGE